MPLAQAIAIVTGSQEADEEQSILAWHTLIDSGVIYNLPGSFGRKAQELLDAGLL